MTHRQSGGKNTSEKEHIQSNEQRDTFIATKISQWGSLPYPDGKAASTSSTEWNYYLSASICSYPKENPKSKLSTVDAKSVSNEGRS